MKKLAVVITLIISISLSSAGCLESSFDEINEYIDNLINPLEDDLDEDGDNIVPDPNPEPTPPINNPNIPDDLIITPTPPSPNDPINPSDPNDTYDPPVTPDPNDPIPDPIDIEHVDGSADVEILNVRNMAGQGEYQVTDLNNPIYLWASNQFNINTNRFDIASSQIYESNDDYVFTIKSNTALPTPEANYVDISPLQVGPRYYGEERIVYIFDVYIEDSNNPTAHIVIRDWRTSYTETKQISCYLTDEDDYMSDSISHYQTLQWDKGSDILRVFVPKQLFDEDSSQCFFPTIPTNYGIEHLDSTSWIVSHYRNPVIEGDIGLGILDPPFEYEWEGILIYDACPDTATQPLRSEDEIAQEQLNNIYYGIGIVSVVIIGILLYVVSTKKAINKRQRELIDPIYPKECPDDYSYDNENNRCKRD